MERKKAVPRSSAQKKAADRADPPLHYASLGIGEPTLLGVRKITLVDDVVTRGSTIMGAAARILETWPDARIQAFAVARVDSEQELTNVKEMLDLALDEVRYDPSAGHLERRPLRAR